MIDASRFNTLIYNLKSLVFTHNKQEDERIKRKYQTKKQTKDEDCVACHCGVVRCCS